MQNIARKPDQINENVSDQPLLEQKHDWERQENEPSLWYGRFQRYLRLGPKRSLQAALADEQGTAKVLESTKVDDTKSEPTKNRTKKGKSGPEEKNLTPLPTVKVAVQVPGSWKQASIRYNWVERSKVFDMYFIRAQTEKAMVTWSRMGLTSTSDRVEALNQLYKAANDMFNHATVYDTKIKLLVRMEAIVKEIRDEMQLYNEAFERDIVEKRQTQNYILATQERAQESIKQMFPSR